MFENLTEKFRSLFSSLASAKKLTEENIRDAVREVRLALLEADVSYSIVSGLVQRIKEKAIGESVVKTISPREQFIKIVHDELAALMGDEESSLNLKEKPSVIMLLGLQGSGKTTHAAKLAHFLKKKKEKILLGACDLQRPAAIEQLCQLGSSIGVPVFSLKEEKNPVKVAKKALQKAIEEKFDVLIVDTAGRLHLDQELMQELKEIKECVQPQEILFVANATTGQDAIRAASEFDKEIQITGSILTMLDGDCRAGAALSIREVTKKPLKFEGIGEKIEDLQIFNPSSMADRILGMGDVINLVRKAEEAFDEGEGKKMEEKLRKAQFTYDDYLRQMGMMKKMGSFKNLLKMVPGLSSFGGDFEMSDKEFQKIESMILSMTLEERLEKEELSHSRRRRIALGSGVKLDEVNRLVKGFKRMKQLIKSVGQKGGFSEMKQKMMGGKTWPL
jgi:signal recognition particle subunit SRP54